MRVSMCACGYTPLPAVLCDHIPADTPLRSLVTSAGVSRWQGLFVCVLICSEETWADSRRRQEEGEPQQVPPPRTTQNVILPLAAACTQPSCWKEQTFKTLWHVSQALPLSQCHWWSWNWQARSHRSCAGGHTEFGACHFLSLSGMHPKLPHKHKLLYWMGGECCSMLTYAQCVPLCMGRINGMAGIMDSRLIKVWVNSSTWRRCPPWPCAPSVLLCGILLAEQMACHFIRADQWHSAIAALRPPPLARVCVCVCILKKENRQLPSYFHVFFDSKSLLLLITFLFIIS